MTKLQSIYIGIDPGKSGGISAITHLGEVVDSVKMPNNSSDLADVLREMRDRSDVSFAYLERVHSSPQMGVKSSFTFGQGYGRLEAVLACLRIPHDVVRPQIWQKELGCMSKGDKNVTKARAAGMFPSVKVTHAISDSLLIAEYCRRMRHGK